MVKERKINIAEVNNIAVDIARIKGVKAVYLFGSHVTGKAHGNSDIDLCVIYDKSARNVEDKILSFNSGNLDVILFSRLPLPIRFRVFKEGKPVVVNDKVFVDNIKLSTLRGYLEIKPLINRFLMERFKCTI